MYKYVKCCGEHFWGLQNVWTGTWTVCCRRLLLHRSASHPSTLFIDADRRKTALTPSVERFLQKSRILLTHDVRRSLPTATGPLRGVLQKGRGMKFVIYFDADGKYRWRLYAPRDRLLAHGAEAFDSKHECVEAILLVKHCKMSEVDDQAMTQV